MRLPGSHCVTSAWQHLREVAGPEGSTVTGIIAKDTVWRMNSHRSFCCHLLHLSLLKPNFLDYPTSTLGSGKNGVTFFFGHNTTESEEFTLTSKAFHLSHLTSIYFYRKVKTSFMLHCSVLEPKPNSTLFSRLSSGWVATSTENPRVQTS